MLSQISGFLRDEEGAVAIEYGLILLIIVLGVVYGATQIGTKTGRPFNTLGNYLG